MKLSMIAVACVAAALMLVPSFAVAAYVETFDTDNAGWNVGYGLDFQSPQLGATSVSPGGNPGGYISGSVTNTDTGHSLYAMWTNDTARFGDMNGTTLTIDTMVTGGASGTAQFYVGRGGTYFVDGQWDISSDANWTTHQAELNTTNFVPWTGVNDGVYTLAEVLQAPTDVGIFFGGGMATGAGTLNIDNYGTVPEPATMGLLILGGLAALARRRRMA
jgi:hypothetical protein